MNKKQKSEDRITLHRSRDGTHEVTVSRVVETTECERLAKVSAESQAIGAFLDWLISERADTLALCCCDAKNRWAPASVDINALLAAYYEIDLAKVERERRRLIAALREVPS